MQTWISHPFFRAHRVLGDHTGLLLVLLLTLLPRIALLKLGVPFWFDEDWTEETGLMPLTAMWDRVRTEDFHPMLGYLLLGAWARLMHILGLEAEVFYPILPVLLGAYSAVVLFRILSAFLPPHQAFLGALVYALVPQGVVQDTEFRMYAPAKLAVALALEAVQRGRALAWAAYGALAFHLHYLAGLVALSLFPVLRRPWGSHLLLFALPLLLWLPVVLHQASRLSGIARWVGTPEEQAPAFLSFLLFNREPVLLGLGLLFWAPALLGLLLSPWRASLGVMALGVALLFLLGFQPLTPRYAYLLLPLLAFGFGWFLKRRASGPSSFLLPLALLLGWLWCWPWLEVTAWGTYWFFLLP